MKKIILFLNIVVIFTVFAKNTVIADSALSIVNNGDSGNYESKKVFDKVMDLYITSNYQKYKKDSRMQGVLGDGDKSLPVEERYKDELYCLQQEEFGFTLADDISYKVVSVVENNNKSEITVEVTAKKIDAGKQEFLEEYKNTTAQNPDYDEKYVDYSDIVTSYVSLRAKAKRTDVTRVITVYMEKGKKGWVFSNGKNKDFFDMICFGLSGYIEDYF